ncbi:hypothetical protein MBLNU457_5907t1 [Dothideomycetes sp. NU457]
MSLNGLDVPAVSEAYNTATTEAAGWFLLKYVSRDVVELLGSGTAGVSEAKTVVQQYEDKSPLYGVIMFRRKKVLIKYVPEGTSRLLQARTTVHFQSIVEKYSPYEATLEISDADAFNDTSLAAAFPLHAGTAAGTAKKLDEITEDAEENTLPPRPRVQHTPSMTSMSSRISSRKAALERSTAYKRSATPATTRPPALRITSDDGSTATPLDSPAHSSHYEEEVERANSILGHFPVPPGTPERRASAHYDVTNLDNSRTPDRDGSEAYQTFDYKPKVKLGPRPVTLSEKKRRPQATSTNGRPTSSLPPGLQVKSKQSQSSLKPKESALIPVDSPMAAEVMMTPALPAPPPIPDSPHDSLPSRPGSRGSARSTPSRMKGGMTPEKQRLLKAVEMRKKQMRRMHETEAIKQPDHPIPETVQETGKEHIRDEIADRKNSIRDSTSNQSARKSDSGVDMVGYDSINQPRDESMKEQGSPKTAVIEETTNAGAENLHSVKESEHPPRDTVRSVSKPIEVEEWVGKHSSPPRASSPALHPIVGNGTDSVSGADDNESRQDSHAQGLRGDDELEEEEPTFCKRSAEQQRRRQGFIMPLTISTEVVPKDDISDAESINHSDDELMDELSNATVHQAKPVPVGKSPVQQHFRPNLEQRISSQSVPAVNVSDSPTIVTIQRTFSQRAPPRKSSLGDTLHLETPPKPILTRSQSDSNTSTPNKDTEEFITPTRKSSVRPGISKRIEALAERSRPSSPQSPRSVSPLPTPSKENVDAPSKRTLDNETIAKQGPKPNGIMPWRNQPAKRSFSSNSSGNGTQTVYTVKEKPNNGQRDSVSVTARIVRSNPADGSPQKSSDLHRSPITISHQRTAPPQTSYQNMTAVMNNTKRDSISSDQVSILSSQHDRAGAASPVLSRKSNEALKRKSFSRYQGRMSSVSEATNPEPKDNDTATIESQPRGSRTSRFLKRMSALGGGRSKKTSAAAPDTAPVKEHDDSHKDRDVPPPASIGDMNVQFPSSNNLWKRRWVEIDNGGYLVLTANKRYEMGGPATKKFHLSEFGRVFAPEIESRGLGHCVVLELKDGREGLVCACDDGMGTRHLLSLLRTHHQAWTAS